VLKSFIILTAHGHDPHQEALSTLRHAPRARVFTVDVFALDFSDDLEDADGPMHGQRGSIRPLLLYLRPGARPEWSAPQGLRTPRRNSAPATLRTSAGSLPKRSPGSLGRPSIATREKGRAAI